MQQELENLKAAAQQTLRLGPTRMKFVRYLRFPLSGMFEIARRTGWIGRAIYTVMRVMEEISAAKMSAPMPGVVDFQARRYCFEYDGGRNWRCYNNGVKYIGGRRRAKPLRMGVEPASPAYEPLWLVQLILGSTAIVDGGPLDEKKHKVICDLGLASTEGPGRLAVPHLPRTASDAEELSKIPLDVILDNNGNISRISMMWHASSVELELYEHGNAPESLFPPLPDTP